VPEQIKVLVESGVPETKIIFIFSALNLLKNLDTVKHQPYIVVEILTVPRDQGQTNLDVI
jgi:hypothetical protein